MAGIKSYKDLEVWKKSMELVKDVYLITRGFPKDELYGLTSQMRRSAVSIPSKELGYIAPEKLSGALEKADHVSRMTRNLIKSLSALSANRSPQTASRSII